MNSTELQVDRTLSALSGWYDVSPSFAHEVLTKFVGEYDKCIETVQDVISNYEHSWPHIEYALSTNVRGKVLQNWVSEQTSFPSLPARFLDIGCAYGGLLHAFATKGFDVTGLEIDPSVAGMGAVNLNSLGGSCEIVVGDFLSNEVLNRPSYFDVICCNDVIEHVADPRECLKKIFNLLTPGGIAYIETVNKRSILNNIRDIHFGLFGINLLRHHSASAAYRQLTGWGEYQVSDYYYSEWYVSNANALGAKVSIPPSNDTFPSFHEAMREFTNKFYDWKVETSQRLDFYLRYEIEEKYYEYCRDINAARMIAHADGDDKHFQSDWIDPLTRIVITKPL